MGKVDKCSGFPSCHSQIESIGRTGAKVSKKTKTIHLELPSEIDGYIQSMAKIQDRTVRNMVLVLIKQALKANGVKL